MTYCCIYFFCDFCECELHNLMCEYKPIITWFWHMRAISSKSLDHISMSQSFDKWATTRGSTLHELCFWLLQFKLILLNDLPYHPKKLVWFTCIIYVQFSCNFRAIFVQFTCNLRAIFVQFTCNLYATYVWLMCVIFDLTHVQTWFYLI